jgi:hypothetical protein
LRGVFGLEVWRRVETKRSNGRKLTSWRWVSAEREMSPRERRLVVEAEYTLPVDFHSWRRAFNQALADAGAINAQKAQAHERYLRNTEKMRRLPVEALSHVLLPNLGVSASPMLKLASGDRETAVGVAGFDRASRATAADPRVQHVFCGNVDRSLPPDATRRDAKRRTSW